MVFFVVIAAYTDTTIFACGTQLCACEFAGECEEKKPGLFTRAWSGGVASVDCNAIKATLDFKQLTPL